MATDLIQPGERQEHPTGALRGFTILELLVAMAIFSLLLVVLASASGGISRLWVSTRESSTRQQSERAILNFLAHDLKGALLPIDRSNPNGLQLIRNPPTVSDSYRSGDTIFWQAPIATDVTQGDIAIVGYFVHWAGTKATLCRLFVNPTETANYRIQTSPENWINDGILASAAPADKASGYLGLMAENVVGFWAQPLDAHGRAIPTPANFDSRSGYTDSVGKTFPMGSLPPAVKVSIALIDTPRAARLPSSLQTLATSSVDADDFLKKVKADPSLADVFKGLRAYTTSVALINSR